MITHISSLHILEELAKDKEGRVISYIAESPTDHRKKYLVHLVDEVLPHDFSWCVAEALWVAVEVSDQRINDAKIHGLGWAFRNPENNIVYRITEDLIDSTCEVEEWPANQMDEEELP